MRDERVSGRGQVDNAQTGESLGVFDYVLAVGRRPGSVLWHTDADIGLDFSTAVKAQAVNARLTLRLEDGRCFDFFVSRVAMGGRAADIEVVAAGGIRACDGP